MYTRPTSAAIIYYIQNNYVILLYTNIPAHLTKLLQLKTKIITDYNLLKYLNCLRKIQICVIDKR